MKKYETILFDWDNCLAITADFWAQGYKIVLEKKGITLSDEEMLESFRKFAKEDIHPVDPTMDIEVLWDEVGVVVTELNKNVKLHNNALEMLVKVKKKKIKTALISTSAKTAINSGVDACNITHYFDVIIGKEDVAKIKPDPEGLFMAMQTLNADPQTTIMVGDKDVDVYAAHSAGTESVLYFPEVHKQLWDYDEFIKSKPTYVIKDLIELLEIV